MKKLTFFFGILLILLIGINSPKSAAFAPIASSGGSKIFEGTDAISFYCEVNSDTVLQNLMHFHDANDLTTCSQVNSTCPSPANLQVNAISSCAILVSWNGTGEASNFKVRYRISGTAQWTTYAVGSDTSFTISG